MINNASGVMHEQTAQYFSELWQPVGAVHQVLIMMALKLVLHFWLWK